MNCYGRVADLKSEVKGGGAGSSDDAVLFRVLERSARLTDDHCNRQFFAELATHLYDGRGQTFGADDGLWLPDDLISVTTLKVDQDGDGVYETTLAANTDYWLYPDNDASYIRIDLNPRSSVLSRFPIARRAIQIVGLFGFSYELQAAGTLGAAIADTTGTAVTMTAGHDVGVGDTIVIGSEQLDVIAVATNTLTVVRGINGTTAATHLISTAVSRRRFPRAIEQATVMQAARLFRETQTGYGGQIGNAELAGYSFRSAYPAIRDALAPYVVPVAA